VISFAQFKLPHYLNITIPLFSVLTASYLHSLNIYLRDKAVKFLLGVQYFILGLVYLVSVLITFYVFKLENNLHYIVLFSLFALIAYFCLKRERYFYRVVTLSVYSALLLNIVLNGHFYPSLLKYQGGSTMSEIVKENKIPVDNIYKISDMHTWALDFYNQKPVIVSSIIEINHKKDIWIYTTDDELKHLRSIGFDWDKQYTVDQFRITRLQAKFLNTATRRKVLNKMHLIHVY